jgi:S1-C subfamily serine protease
LRLPRRVPGGFGGWRRWLPGLLPALIITSCLTSAPDPNDAVIAAATPAPPPVVAAGEPAPTPTPVPEPAAATVLATDDTGTLRIEVPAAWSVRTGSAAWEWPRIEASPDLLNFTDGLAADPPRPLANGVAVNVYRPALSPALLDLPRQEILLFAALIDLPALDGCTGTGAEILQLGGNPFYVFEGYHCGSFTVFRRIHIDPEHPDLIISSTRIFDSDESEIAVGKISASMEILAEPAAVATPRPAAAAPTATRTPAPTATPTPRPPETREELLNATVVFIAVETVRADRVTGAIAEGFYNGSGTFISPDGLILTAAHVVVGAGEIRVHLPGEAGWLDAELVAASECRDLALIDVSGNDHAFLRFAEDAGPVDQPIYTAGYDDLTDLPQIHDGTRAEELSSAGLLHGIAVRRALQHDAATFPGFSGGPVVNAQAEILGVSVVRGDVVNIAIPVAIAAPAVEGMLAGGERDWIGGRTSATPADAPHPGMLVESVEAGSAAAELGLAPGDVILRLAGVDLATGGSAREYCEVLYDYGGDAELPIRVLRPAEDLVYEGVLNHSPLIPLGRPFRDAVLVPVVDNAGTFSLEVPDYLDALTWIPTLNLPLIGAYRDTREFNDALEGVPGDAPFGIQIMRPLVMAGADRLEREALDADLAVRLSRIEIPPGCTLVERRTRPAGVETRPWIEDRYDCQDGMTLLHATTASTTDPAHFFVMRAAAVTVEEIALVDAVRESLRLIPPGLGPSRPLEYRPIVGAQGQVRSTIPTNWSFESRPLSDITSFTVVSPRYGPLVSGLTADAPDPDAPGISMIVNRFAAFTAFTPRSTLADYTRQRIDANLHFTADCGLVSESDDPTLDVLGVQYRMVYECPGDVRVEFIAGFTPLPYERFVSLIVARPAALDNTPLDLFLDNLQIPPLPDPDPARLPYFSTFDETGTLALLVPADAPYDGAPLPGMLASLLVGPDLERLAAAALDPSVIGPNGVAIYSEPDPSRSSILSSRIARLVAYMDSLPVPASCRLERSSTRDAGGAVLHWRTDAFECDGGIVYVRQIGLTDDPAPRRVQAHSVIRPGEGRDLVAPALESLEVYLAWQDFAPDLAGHLGLFPAVDDDGRLRARLPGGWQVGTSPDGRGAARLETATDLAALTAAAADFGALEFGAGGLSIRLVPLDDDPATFDPDDADRRDALLDGVGPAIGCFNADRLEIDGLALADLIVLKSFYCPNEGFLYAGYALVMTDRPYRLEVFLSGRGEAQFQLLFRVLQTATLLAPPD